MKTILVAAAFALFSGPVLADQVTVTHPGVVIEHRATDEDVVKKKSIHHDADGCATKSVTKSNDEGDAVTKTKTRC